MKTKHRTYQLSEKTTPHKKKNNNGKRDKNVLFFIGCIITLVLLGIVAYILGRNRITISHSSIPANETSSVDTSPQTTTIFLTHSGWTPSIVTIKMGGTVSWVNETFEDATVDSNPQYADKRLNLGVFSRGDAVSLTFSTPGEYNYINKLHPGEQGTIRVK